MKKRAKEKWIAALRGGEYKQTVGQLKDEDRYCCLGVLCDLYSKAKRKKWSLEGIYGSILGHSSDLPEEVFEWAGQDIRSHQETLISMNDDENKTFTTIANYIEKNL